MPNPGPSAAEGVRAVSGELRARDELASFVDEALPAWQRQTVPAGDEVTSLAEFLADWLLGFGYRRVSEDDVPRVAASIDNAVRVTWPGCPDEFVSSPEDWTLAARAAVRALREEA